jgi:hypothetical protein
LFIQTVALHLLLRLLSQSEIDRGKERTKRREKVRAERQRGREIERKREREKQ